MGTMRKRRPQLEKGVSSAIAATIVFVTVIVAVIAGGYFLLKGEREEGEVEEVGEEGGLTPHAPIHIVGNDNFTSANGVVAGSGTENDPYIIENWDINAENARGIWVNNTSAHFIIRNCCIHDEKGVYSKGVRFDNVTNGKIENCVFSKSGITVSGEYTPDYWTKCSHIVIRNCEISNNGIVFWLCSHTVIENCTISNNGEGISFFDSPNNIVRNCTLENNELGIGFGTSYSTVVTGMFTENNHIYHNSFVTNTCQASAGWLFPNYWENGYPSGGNYWSDYTGIDENRGENQNISGSDGIGDTPYDILGSNNQDRYPLMNPT